MNQAQIIASTDLGQVEQLLAEACEILDRVKRLAPYGSTIYEHARRLVNDAPGLRRDLLFPRLFIQKDGWGELVCETSSPLPTVLPESLTVQPNLPANHENQETLSPVRVRR